MIPDGKLGSLIIVVRTHLRLFLIINSCRAVRICSYKTLRSYDCHYERFISSTLSPNSNRTSVSILVISRPLQVPSWSDWHHIIISILLINFVRTSLNCFEKIVPGTTFTTKGLSNTWNTYIQTLLSSREKGWSGRNHSDSDGMLLLVVSYIVLAENV